MFENSISVRTDSGGSVLAFFCGLYGFTGRSAKRTPFGDVVFLFYVFTDLSTNPTPFGDSIFLLVKKDRGERHAKGLQSRPLESCFYTGVRRGDVRRFYVFALVQLTRFRPVASSQTPYPSFCLSGQKLSHSVAPPFPTKPTSLGFGGGPFLHCFHGLMLTARSAAKTLTLKE